MHTPTHADVWTYLHHNGNFVGCNFNWYASAGRIFAIRLDLLTDVNPLLCARSQNALNSIYSINCTEALRSSSVRGPSNHTHFNYTAVRIHKCQIENRLDYIIFIHRKKSTKRIHWFFVIHELNLLSRSLSAAQITSNE